MSSWPQSSARSELRSIRTCCGTKSAGAASRLYFSCNVFKPWGSDSSRWWEADSLREQLYFRAVAPADAESCRCRLHIVCMDADIEHYYLARLGRNRNLVAVN